MIMLITLTDKASVRR